MWFLLRPALQGVQEAIDKVANEAFDPGSVCHWDHHDCQGEGFGEWSCAEGDSMGAGVLGCEGLLKSLGSHREQHAMLFARLVTVLEKRHHNGGFGVPANVSLMEMWAATDSTAIDCAAAVAEWPILRQASLWLCLAINSAWSSPR
jgi:hypothetical protein